MARGEEVRTGSLSADGSPSAAPSDADGARPGPGTVVGRYVLLEELGQGGMGIVHAGLDRELGRKVALKLLLPQQRADEARARLVREAQALAQVEHPNVVPIYDVGFHGDQAFLAMKLVRGRSLRRWLEAGRTWREILAVFIPAARGIAAIHAAGLVHRDVKPDNVLIGDDGAVLVVDFGLAKLVALRPDEVAATPGAQGVTQAGARVGTPAYMSPEQQRGEPGDAASDQYSFCVALREALDGARPQRVPPALRAIVARGLAPDPADRMPSMGALADALAAVASKRWPLAATLGVALLAGAIAVGAVAVTGADAAPAAAMRIDKVSRVTFDPGAKGHASFLPDGRVMFDLGVAKSRDIFVQDPTTGARDQLTHSGAGTWSFAACASGDGAQVAYLRMVKRGLVTLQVLRFGADPATARDLGPVGGYPSWTRQGAVIAAERDTGRIFSWSAEALAAPGPAPAPTVIADLGARIRNVPYVRDGGDRLIALASPDEQAKRARWLDLVEYVDGAPRVIEARTTWAECGLALTDDGIYYTRLAADGVLPALVRAARADGSAAVGPRELRPGSLDITRDRTRLVFTEGVDNNRVVWAHADGRVQRLFDGSYTMETDPVPTDAQHVVFAADRGHGAQLWLAEIGGDERAITAPEVGARAPAVARDGRVVYETARGIALAPRPGEPATALSDQAGDARPTFARDGASVLFLRREAGQRHVFALPVGGGPARAVISDADVERFAVSPVDDRVVAVEAVAGGRKVVLYDLAAGTSRVVHDGDRDDHEATFSPDGARLALVSRASVNEVPVTGDGPPVEHRFEVSAIVRAAYAPGGDGFVLAVDEFEGDVWIAEGWFP